MILSHTRKCLKLIAASLMLTAISSCSYEFDDKHDEPDDSKEINPAHRTILVYMESTSLNNTTQDIREMQALGATGSMKGNSLVVFNKSNKNTQTLFKVNLSDGSLDTLKVYDNNYPALSVTRLKDVINDTKKFAEADDYGLVLWSHGSGWWVRNDNNDNEANDHDNNEGVTGKAVTLSFGMERFDYGNVYFDIPVLAEALEGEDLQFIYFDACYMGGIEVLYDLKDVTQYVIASTAEVVWDGMPYDIGLPFLYEKRPDYTALVNAVCNFAEMQQDGQNDYCTIAAFDMSKIENVASTTRSFYECKPVAPADFTPQKFMWETTCYFFDFLDIIDNLQLPEDSDIDPEEFEYLRDNVDQAVAECVIAKANTEYIWPGITSRRVKIDSFCGMSSNYLTSPVEAAKYGYDKTSWWNDVAKYQF